MATTDFTDQTTAIVADWLNDVDDHVYGTSHAEYLKRNGTVALTANLPANNKKITGLAAGTASGDAVSFNQAGVKFPSLGIGTASSAWAGNNSAMDIGPQGALACFTNGPVLYCNSYFDGTDSRAKETGPGAALSIADGVMTFYTYASVSAGAVQTLVQRGKIDTSGFWGVGTNITALNATELTSGTVPAARLSGTYNISVSGSAATASAATDYKSRALSSATRSSGTGEATTYSSEVYDTGSNFNATTGRFTAPATGVYLVTWTVQANASAGSSVAAFARVNGSTPNLGSVVAITGTTVGGAVAVPLTAGQYVSIWMSVSGSLDCLINEFQVNRLA